MTNHEQAKAYIAKQKLIGKEMFNFEYNYCETEDIEIVAIKKNPYYTWTNDDKEIIIPSFISVVAPNAFNDCKVIEKVTFQNPDNITEIRHRAFAYCKNLKEIEIPPNVNEIKDSAFRQCIMLEHIEIPDSVREIGAEAFSFCESLEKVKLSEKLSHINYRTFSGCKSLKNINIPNSVMGIGYYAFCECMSLESFQIDYEKSRLNKIYDYAFCDCISFKNLKEFINHFDARKLN